jgi:putative NIF3 family GTP cyclohydrolase 1 type 2
VQLVSADVRLARVTSYARARLNVLLIRHSIIVKNIAKKSINRLIRSNSSLASNHCTFGGISGVKI